MKLEVQDNTYISNILTTFFTIIILFFFVYIIHLTYHPDISLSRISSMFNPEIIGGFLPEPVERMQYVASLLILPFVIIALQLLFKSFKLKWINYNTLFFLLLCLVLLFTAFGIRQVNYYYISRHILCEYPIIGFLASLLLVSMFYCIKHDEKFKMFSFVTIITSLYISVYIAYMLIFTSYAVDTQPAFQVHFSALYYSVAAVMYKHTLLVNLQNQYGLYPELLRPLFQLVGLSVYKFTIVMSGLIGITFLSWFYLLYSNLEQKFIAFVGFITMIYFSFLFTHSTSIDPYFQVFPLRTIFPSILLIITTSYLKYKNNLYYYIGWFFVPIGLLWNVESGVVAYLSWLAFLAYKEFAVIDGTLRRRLTRHIVTGTFFTSGIILLYLFYILLKSGHIPNFKGLIEYAKIYYSYGYYMLPMPILHPWNIIILIYIIGLVISINSIINRKYNTLDNMVFFISILGLGVFSYYQGRSHDIVLTAAWYPAFLLLPIYTQKLIRSKLKIHVATAYMIIFFLSSTTITAFITIPQYGELQERALKLASKKERSSSLLQIEFINKYCKKGDEITILSFNSGVYYSETKTTPELSIPGPIEMLLNKDYDELQSKIKNKAINLIFLDKNYLDYSLAQNTLTVNLIKDNYVPVSYTHLRRRRWCQ